MRGVLCGLWLSLGAVVSVGVQAEIVDRDVAELGGITVTATRTEQSGYDAPNAVTVVTSEEMSRRMSFGIIDSLTDEAGVFSQRTTNGHGSPMVRGFTGYHTLILVDGVRLNNTTFRSGPNQYFNTLDVWGADRIEVVRGPSTMLYGSSSLGGVINVLSRGPTPMGESLEVRPRLFGRFGSSGSNAAGGFGLSGGQGRLSFDATVNYKSIGDVQPGQGRDVHVKGRKFLLTGAETGIPTTFTSNGLAYERTVVHDEESPTDYSEAAGNVAVDYLLDDRQSLRLVYQGVQQVVSSRWDKVGSGEEFSVHEFDPQDRHMGYVKYSADSLIPRVDSLSATLSFHRQVEGLTLVRVGDDSTTTRTLDATNTLGGSVVATSALDDPHALTVGADVYYDTVASERQSPTRQAWGTYPDDSTALDINVFAQTRSEVADRVDVTLGGAFTSYDVTTDLSLADPSFGVLEKTGTAVTGAASVGVEAVEGVKLFAAAGTGFRAPSLSDLSAVRVTNQSVSATSPDLEPEKSVKFEGGVKVRRGRIGGSLTLFRTNLRDSYVSRSATEVYGDDVPQFIRTIQARFPEVPLDEISVTVGIDKSVVRGVEADLYLSPARDVTVYGVGNVTRGQILTVNGEDPDPSKPWEARMRREPPINGTVGVRYEPTGSSYWGEFFARGAVAQRRLSRGDIRDPRIPGFTRNVDDVAFDADGNAVDAGTPGFVTVNVRAGISLFGSGRVTAAVENIFDRRYRWHGSGVDAPGRNLVLSVENRF